MKGLKVKHRVAGTMCFIAYIVLLFYLLFFSEAMGRGVMLVNYQYNFKPMHEIIRYLGNIAILGPKLVLVNLLGNILAFLPFGFFLPIVLNKKLSVWLMLLASSGLSALAEVVQCLSRVGSFDIDDIILNTIGGLIGYGLFVLFFKKRHKIEEDKNE